MLTYDDAYVGNKGEPLMSTASHNYWVVVNSN